MSRCEPHIVAGRVIPHPPHKCANPDCQWPSAESDEYAWLIEQFDGATRYIASLDPSAPFSGDAYVALRFGDKPTAERVMAHLNLDAAHGFKAVRHLFLAQGTGNGR